MTDAIQILTLKEGPRDLSQAIKQVGTNAINIGVAAITVPKDWQGLLIRFSRDCIVTVPSDLPPDFSCGWSQDAAGQIEFVAGSGTTLQSAGGLLHSAQQYAIGGMSGMGVGVVRLYGNMGI